MGQICSDRVRRLFHRLCLIKIVQVHIFMTKKTFDELHRLEKGETEHLMAFFLLSGGSHNKNFILSFWPKMKNGWQKRSISQLKGQSLKITSVNQTVVKSTSDTEFPLHWSSHLILGNGGLKKVAQYFVTGGH